jgi:hypothetical protein
MIDIFAMVFAVLCPAVVMFWPLKCDRIWISLARCLIAIAVFWCSMAGVQQYDLVSRVQDGRAHSMGEAESMAGYIFGPLFWIIPGTLYGGFLLLIRVLLHLCKRQTRAA